MLLFTLKQIGLAMTQTQRYYETFIKCNCIQLTFKELWGSVKPAFGLKLHGNWRLSGCQIIMSGKSTVKKQSYWSPWEEKKSHLPFLWILSYMPAEMIMYLKLHLLTQVSPLTFFYPYEHIWSTSSSTL